MFVRRDPDIQARNPFLPNFIADSVANIDFKWLHAQGIRACLIDLDGTVVPRATFEVGNDIKKVLRNAPIKLYIATNRPKSRDLKNLREDLRADGVIHPKGMFGKPFKRYFETACRELHLDRSEVAMIGDRFLQDIYGANRAGISTILISDKIGAPQGWIDKQLSDTERKLAQRIAKNYQPAK